MALSTLGPLARTLLIFGFLHTVVTRVDRPLLARSQPNHGVPFVLPAARGTFLGDPDELAFLLANDLADVHGLVHAGRSLPWRGSRYFTAIGWGLARRKASS